MTIKSNNFIDKRR